MTPASANQSAIQSATQSATRVHASGHRVIDMRCRPAYLHDFFGKTPGSPDRKSVV